MKIKCTIEFMLDEFILGDDAEEMELAWFKDDVLTGNGTLILLSNEIGDEIGTIHSITNIEISK